jgi:heme/copper-type cytochrome/quinol oxidase subunit 3
VEVWLVYVSLSSLSIETDLGSSPYGAKPNACTFVNIFYSYIHTHIHKHTHTRRRKETVRLIIYLFIICFCFCFWFWFWFLVFRDRVSLYSSGCPGTHFVEQAGLKLRNLPASASRVLGLKACATICCVTPKIECSATSVLYKQNLDKQNAMKPDEGY